MGCFLFCFVFCFCFVLFCFIEKNVLFNHLCALIYFLKKVGSHLWFLFFFILVNKKCTYLHLFISTMIRFSVLFLCLKRASSFDLTILSGMRKVLNVF